MVVVEVVLLLMPTCGLKFPSASKYSAALSAVIHPPLPGTGGGRSGWWWLPALHPGPAPSMSIVSSSSSSSPLSGYRFEQFVNASNIFCTSPAAAVSATKGGDGGG